MLLLQLIAMWKSLNCHSNDRSESPEYIVVSVTVSYAQTRTMFVEHHLGRDTRLDGISYFPFHPKVERNQPQWKCACSTWCRFGWRGSDVSTIEWYPVDSCVWSWPRSLTALTSRSPFAILHFISTSHSHLREYYCHGMPMQKKNKNKQTEPITAVVWTQSIHSIGEMRELLHNIRLYHTFMFVWMCACAIISHRVCIRSAWAWECGAEACCTIL